MEDLTDVFEQIININDCIKDIFVFNHAKYAVLKEECFKDFKFSEINKTNTKKVFIALMAVVDNCEVLLPLSEFEYKQVLDYYIQLKQSFLKE